MIALSCIVVVCTVYALSLPAQTLACDKEEHTHTAECYDENNELICEKEEHTHNEDCNKQEEVNEANEQEESTVVKDEPETVSEEGLTTNNELVLNNQSEYKYSVSMMYKEDGIEKQFPNNASSYPDDLSLKIKLNVTDIPLQDLKDKYNRSFTYNLPEFFNIAQTGPKDILDKNDNNNVIGNINILDGKVVVTYNQEIFNNITSEHKLSGDFEIEGSMKLASLDPRSGKTNFGTPSGNIQLDYGPDYIQRYGNVELAKSHTKVGSSDYIDYTIEVRAGAEGCKDLVVVDKFTQNENLVTYEGITTAEKVLNDKENNHDPYEKRDSDATAGSIYLTNALKDNSKQEIPERIQEGTTLNKPGSFVWTVGNMKPNEIRTLHYYVKLSDSDGVIDVRNNQSIKNTAIVYAKGNNYQVFKKAEKEDTFIPQLNKSMSKTVLPQNGKNYTRDKDGNYTINYKLEFTSNADSNYPLKDFGFWDYLSKTDGDITTNGDITYVKDSIKLFEKKKGSSKYTEIDKNNFNVEWASRNSSEYSDDWNENRLSFHLKGKDGHPITVNPGDSYYVTYSIRVKPEVFAKMQSDSVPIKNSFSVNSSNATQKDGANQGFIASSEITTVNLDDYKWVNKTQTEITKDTPITMSGKRYNESFVEDNEATTFTVPKDSYKYEVIVNKTHGLWDVTNATLQDSFSSKEMVYVGYAKISAHDEKSGSDLTPVWLKIDGKSNFSIDLKRIGFNKENTYSYTIEYYAKPKDLSMVSQVTVTNTFALNGTVKKGNDTFTSNFDRVNSSSSVTLVGDYNIGTSKYSWYYEKPKEDATYWKNGKLYWVIEVSGSGIKKGTKITDCISSDSNLEDHFLHSDPHGNDGSIVGVYLNNDNPSTNYTSFEEYSNTHTPENIDDYFDIEYNKGKFGNIASVASQDYGKLILTAKKNIDLNQKNMYIVIQTKPCNLPREYRKPLTYRNELWKKDPGEKDTKMKTADKKLYYGGDILKELGQVFTYDGTYVVTDRSVGGKDIDWQEPESKISTELLENRKGVYASWAFKLNYSGELQGDYRVEEQIPEGMDLAYIRIKWHGQNASDVQSTVISNLGNDWDKMVNTSTNDNGNSQPTTYYVSKDKRRALIQLGSFTASKEEDTYSVDVQVVCRVTDSSVLLDGNSQTFTNNVTLLNKDGSRTIATAKSNATIQKNNLEKSHVENGKKINYTIVVNPLGQNLPSNASDNKLKLIDELSNTLELDLASIKIEGDNNNIDKSFDKDTNTLEITVPNEQRVVITYTATVKAAPDSPPVTLTNKVYWKDHLQNGGITDTINEYSYSFNATGTSQIDKNPDLTIIKMDADTLEPMRNVKFKVYECELKNGEIHHVQPEVEGITGSDGTFKQTKEFNKIYEVKEKETPKGYIENKESKYIMCVKQDASGHLSEDVQAYIDYCNSKQDSKYTYVANVSDFDLTISTVQKGITVKQFTNNAAETNKKPVSGTYKFGLYDNPQGNLLETISIKYKPGDKVVKSAKFKNPDDLDGKYYVFELDQNDKPISASKDEAYINSMQYKVVYESNSKATNIAKVGDTVTVTNKNRTKILPSTGGTGNLIYRMSGTALVVVGVISLSIIDKKKRKKKVGESNEIN